MLKHRLVFGLLMTVAFVGLMLVDGWLDGSITSSVLDDKPVQGTLLCILVALLIIPAQFELRTLSAAKNMKIFIPVAVTSSILFATTWYWPQLIAISPAKYLALVLAFTLFALFLYQHFNFGNSGVIANCGANYFAIIYTGLLAAFIPAIRIEFGLWALLMFIFVIKSSDIGAYTAGKLFGKHKFSPKISPAKTWEGMAGAVIFAVVVSMLFAQNFDIMPWPFAVAFGFVFAFIGQFGDLAESMIKRDAEQKDSANNVPGFGGILDVLDSPLAGAVFAYLYFSFCIGS